MLGQRGEDFRTSDCMYAVALTFPSSAFVDDSHAIVLVYLVPQKQL